MSELPLDGEYLGRAPMEEGEYLLKYVKHQRADYKGQPKLVINFQIVGSDHEGRLVPRFYNVEARETNEHSKQNWTPRPGGDLVKELIAVFADTYDVESVRLEKIPIKKWFSAHLVVGEIVMVQKDAEKKPVHELAQQAKVKRLLRIGKEGDDLTLPCLTPPYPSHPHPLEHGSEVDEQKDGVVGSCQKDKADLGILPQSDDEKTIQKLIDAGVAETGEDVERLTGGRISADQARKLHWFLE